MATKSTKPVTKTAAPAAPAAKGKMAAPFPMKKDKAAAKGKTSKC